YKVCVFVKAARYNFTIPCDDTALPHFPAMIVEAILDRPRSIWILPVPRIAILARNERRSVFKIVNLRRLEYHLVNTKIPRQSPYRRYFMFVGTHDQKLKDKMRRARL